MLSLSWASSVLSVSYTHLGNGMQVAKVYSLFIRAGMRDVFYKFYKDGRHEMLNELNRDEVYRDILNWLFKKID